MKSVLFSALFLFACAQVNAQKVQVDNCDSEKGWSNSLTVDHADFKEGTGSLQTESVSPFLFRKVFTTPVNTGLDGKSGYIALWLYISDVAALHENPGSLQISSSNRSQDNAHHWSFKSLKLEKGWNKLVFELNENSATGGDFDGSNLKYFMLMQKTTQPITFKIDDIRFAKNLKDL